MALLMLAPAGMAALVRLFDSCVLRGESDAPPGTLIGFEGGRLAVAARGGRIGVAKARVGDAKKVPAPEAGLEPGARLD